MNSLPNLIDVGHVNMAEKKKKWIASATENAHGQFAAKAKAAGKTTKEYASEHQHDSGKLGKQARLAMTLMGMHHDGAKKKHSPSQARKAMYGSEK